MFVRLSHYEISRSLLRIPLLPSFTGFLKLISIDTRQAPMSYVSKRLGANYFWVRNDLRFVLNGARKGIVQCVFFHYAARTHYLRKVTHTRMQDIAFPWAPVGAKNPSNSYIVALIYRHHVELKTIFIFFLFLFN